MYLDANATSQLRPEARAAIVSLLGGVTALNPSSVHADGRKARSVLAKARDSVLRALIGKERQLRPAKMPRLFFTSGGTEGCNVLVTGFLGDLPGTGSHILTSDIEHPAIAETITALESRGFAVTRVGPSPGGRIEPASLAAALLPSTAIVALMAAHNETGALQPVAECAALLRTRGYSGPIVCDATQAFGKSRLDFVSLFEAGVSAVVLSGHKVGGPAGVGAVVLAGGLDAACYRFFPSHLGGPQEQGLRAGTENIIGIAGFAAAVDALFASFESELTRVESLREALSDQLTAAIPGLLRFTPPSEHALVNTLLLGVPGCRGDDLVVALDLAGLRASTGSACSSGKQQSSRIVRAMGYDDRIAKEVLRLSLDWDATEESVALAAETILRAVERMLDVESLPDPAHAGAIAGRPLWEAV